MATGIRHGISVVAVGGWGVVAAGSLNEQGDSSSSSAGNVTFQILSDKASDTKQHDYLKFGPYAEALAFLIDQKDTSTPLIMTISAPWGAGKTTLAQLVQEQLRAPGDWDEPHIICRFNAWKHDDAPDLGAAFAAEVAQRANRYRHWWRRLIQPIPSAMLTPEQRWRRRLCIVIASISAAVILVLGSSTRDIVIAAAKPTSARWAAAEHQAHGLGLTLLIIFSALAFIYPKILSGTQALARFIEDPGSAAAHGSIDSVRKQLGSLIHRATRGHRRFIIFVDDLERCRPPRAVEVCEVASQLLDHRDVVTVLVADMETIARSAAIKYRALELPDSARADTAAFDQYGRAYLQKLVQIQFDLPPATPAQLKDMLLADRHASRGDTKSPALNFKSSPRIPTSWLVAGIGFIVGLGIIVAGVVLLSKLNTAQFSGAVNIAGVASTVIAVIGGAQAVWSSWRRRKTQETRSRIDETLQKQSVGTTIDEAVAEISAAEGGSNRVSIRKRYFSAVLSGLETSGISAHVDNLVFRFVPERPRAAKRLLNQVHLMMAIAIGRELFGLEHGRSQQERAMRLAKWLILRERWPEIAEVMRRNPNEMTVFDNSADIAGLETVLKGYGLTLVDDIGDLQRLLEARPRFGNIRELMLMTGAPTRVLKSASQQPGSDVPSSA